MRYPTVEIRPNGDVFGSYRDLRRYLQESQLTGAPSTIEQTLEAHHLIEDDFLEQFGISREDAWCVALESTDHSRLAPELLRELGGRRLRGAFFDIDELFEAQASVYRGVGHPEWIEDMRAFLRQYSESITARYAAGAVPGGNLADFPARLARVLEFLKSL